MTLVVAGDIPYELILASFQAIGAPSGLESDATPLPPPEPDRPPVQVLRRWYGEARVVADGRDPHAAVAALLVASELRRSTDDFEAELQLWETADHKVLAVIGAAYRRDYSAMRERIRGVLDATRSGLTRDRVEEVVATLRGEHLMGARSPSGRVAFVGRHLDATGEPLAARSYLERLRGVSLESTRSFLDVLAGRTAVRAELRP